MVIQLNCLNSSGKTYKYLLYIHYEFAILCLNALNYGYDIGELSVTQKLGIITCLPKGNKPRHLLKNYLF